ncbi:MAG: glycosyltransferase family 4 protein [Cetobacterium sp.]|uniref:glycosyltransferase family 4 protein n=1 Tax=Cetobacterium sp. TaxID=2071632 RepID=UPI003EE7C61E
MRILHINHYYHKGGAETVFRSTYEFSKKLGIESYICHSGKEKADLNLENFENVNHFKVIKYIFNLKNFFKLKRFIKEKNINIVHLHSYTAMSPSILLVLRLMKKKIRIIQTVHDYHIVCPNNSLYNFRNNQICEKCLGEKNKEICIKQNCEKRGRLFLLLKYLSNYISYKIRKKDLVDRILVPSNFLKKILIREGFNENQIYVIGNPIDIKEKIIENKKDEIIFFGRLTKEKGIDEIIEVFYEFLKCNDNYILKIIGTGDEKGRLELLVNKLKIQKNVVFKEYLVGEELRKEIAQSKISVMNSIGFETFGLTPLESIMQETIPIVKDIGATKEVLNKIGMQLIFSNIEELSFLLNNVVKNYSNHKEKIEISKLQIKKLNMEYYKKIKEEYLMKGYRC